MPKKADISHYGYAAALAVGGIATTCCSSGAVTVPAVLAGAAGVAVGAVVNYFSGRDEEHRQARKSLTSALENEHLARKAALAVKLCILKCEAITDARARETLAEFAEDYWMKLRASTDQRTGDYAEKELARRLTEYLCDDPATLHVCLGTWRAILLEMQAAAGGAFAFEETTINAIAGTLTREFPQQIYTAFKTDLETGGSAFAGITLRLLTQIAKGLHELGTQPAPRVDLTPLMQRLEMTLDTLLFQFSDVLKGQDEIRSELQGTRDDLRGVVTTLETIRAQTARSIRPFVRISDATHLFGDDAEANAFGPSQREYRERRVHRTALADPVEDSLATGRFACVLGKGASGKTTLALLLAFNATFGPERSYYCDLADADDSPDAAETYRAALAVIARQQGRAALVIVDNVHLAERLVLSLHTGWRDDGKPVHLLFQGRLTEKGPGRGLQSPLAELRRTAHTLTVQAPDLAGVVSRLAARRVNNWQLPEVIPHQILLAWLKVFEGDLVAFSFAVRGRLSKLLRGDFNLTAANASAYVREEYLNHPTRPVSPEERENLLALAACAELEMPVALESLPYPGQLAVSSKHGLVWNSSHGRDGQFQRCRYHHPGMGKLIWAAANPAKSLLEYQCDLGGRYPYFGLYLASRLHYVQGDSKAAKSVLRTVINSTAAFDRLIEHGIDRLRVQCQQLLQLEIISEDALEKHLKACHGLAEAALLTPLGDLQNFLEYVQVKLPAVFKTIENALALPTNREQLVRAALDTPLHILRNFLQYTQIELLNVFTAISGALALPANREQLVNTALHTQLSDLAHCLKYAQIKLPTVYTAISDALTLPVNCELLAAVALATPLHNLRNFLEYAQDALPVAFTAISDALTLPVNCELLAAAALATPLHNLRNFLEYAQDALPVAFTAISDTLTLPVNCELLAAVALATPLHDLRNFLEYAQDELPVVFTVISEALTLPANHKQLCGAALTSPLGDLRNFLEYAQDELPAAFTPISNALALRANREQLVGTALTSPLHMLRNFLEYAQDELPVVFTIINEALTLPANHKQFCEAALTSPLHSWRNFLEYAQVNLSAAFTAISDALVLPANREQLVGASLAAPLDHLASFMRYAQDDLPAVFVSISTALAEDSNHPALRRSALDAGWGNLLGFLRYAVRSLPDVAKIVNAEIATDLRALGITHPRLESVRHNPQMLLPAEAVLNGCGCQDLAESLARLLIRESQKDVWRAGDYFLTVISAVLRLGRGASELETRQFLTLIVTPDRLDRNYVACRLQDIAGALYTVWAWTPRFVRAHFCSRALKARASGLVFNLPRFESDESASDVFELLAACALLGMDAAQTTRWWPAQAQLDRILSARAMNPGDEQLGAHQILFFAGLRVMAGCRRDAIFMDAEIGGRVLACWQKTQPSNPNHHSLNLWMIAWLERCKASRWRLLNDATPIPQPTTLPPRSSL